MATADRSQGAYGQTGTTSSSGARRSTVVGVFDDRRRAEEAVAELERLGFSDSQIGFAVRDDRGSSRSGQGEITTDTGSGSGALTGAATGGILGGIVGAAAALLIPGVGPVVAAGILGPVLGAAAAGAGVGAVGGGLLGGLVTTGVPEDEARYYDEQFQQGRAIVTVTAGDRADEAYRVLKEFGAYDMESQGASTARAGQPRQTRAQTGGTAATGTQSQQSQKTMDRETMDRGQGSIRVPEVEERLDVEKREREMGQVRIEKHVTEERQTVPVDLQREEVHVDRRDVAERPVRPGEDTFEEGTIRVPVRGEEAVVNKQAVVTGEVVVNKERTTEHEQISDTVRKTHVEVDKNVDTHGRSSDWNEASSRYRSMWQQRHGKSGGRWEDYEPAYRYGYEKRNDPRYSGRRFEEAEPELRREWSNRHDPSTWEKFKSNVREAWDSVTS